MLVETHADQFHVAGLLLAQKVARTAVVKIAAADGESRPEPIEGLQRAQALLRRLADFRIRVGQQVGGAARPAPPDTPAQLMQLREAEPVGAPDQDRVGARHVKPAFNDVGR
jgi:hypothetical protein